MDDYVPVTKGPLQRVLHSSTTHDDEQLYRLDVLDLAVTSDIVYTEFKEQFQWSTQDWYHDWVAMETKPPNLYNSKNGSFARLSNLLSKLQRDPALFKEYDDKMKEQLAERIVEETPAATTLKEFYIPHKSVVEQ